MNQKMSKLDGIREKVKRFRETYAVIFCILSIVLAMGLLMLCGMGSAMFLYNTDEYMLLMAQEVGGFLVLTLLIWLFDLWDFKKHKGVPLYKGLVTGGYFMVIGLYSLIAYLLIYQGDKVVKPVLYIIAFFICMIAVGFFEETLFRGIVAETLLRKYGTSKKGIWCATLVSGLLFGMVHLTNMIGTGFNMGVLVQVCVTSGMGILLTAIYYRTGNIMVPIFLHGFIDIAAGITSGIYETSTLVDTIEGYQPVQMLTFLIYLVVVMILYRRKKIGEVAVNMGFGEEHV